MTTLSFPMADSSPGSTWGYLHNNSNLDFDSGDNKHKLNPGEVWRGRGVKGRLETSQCPLRDVQGPDAKLLFLKFL